MLGTKLLLMYIFIFIFIHLYDISLRKCHTVPISMHRRCLHTVWQRRENRFRFVSKMSIVLILSFRFFVRYSVEILIRGCNRLRARLSCRVTRRASVERVEIFVPLTTALLVAWQWLFSTFSLACRENRRRCQSHIFSCSTRSKRTIRGLA